MNRKSLLYQSKVEYGGWTINHVQGCSHGCRYPCYAMSLAKRTGRVKTYEEWCRPHVVDNAMELLESELRRFGKKIESVHLSFTTDPFMWNAAAAQPFDEIVVLTERIIRRLNEAGIRVTTLTKGVYPHGFVQRVRSLHPENQYGVSVVSLSDDFRQRWEPGSAPVSDRLESLKALSEAGAITWASVEPYPTPNVDSTSADATSLLAELSFVDKLVFGRWNYSKLVNQYPQADEHYLHIAQQFAEWATANHKVLHIKRGTPLHESHSADVLALGGQETGISSIAARQASECSCEH